jgi:4-amino-4-deoxy-L-arabinose transferase-like glycosyltransferase
VGMKDDSETAGRSPARGFFGRRRAELLCALLLTLAAATMLTVVRRKSLTVDELVMIPAGYYHVTEGDFRPVNEHPPFAKILAALPLLFTGTEAPPVAPPPGYDYGYFLDLFHRFWRANDARYEAVTFWARVPAVLTTVLLGALLFVYARRYFGERAALFAVALFSLEPTVLAHGRVVQTDIPSALAFVVFAFTFYEYLKGPTVRRAAGTGLAAGFAAVTKFSMLALAPVLGVALAALFLRGPRRAVAAQALALAFAAVLVVHAAYFFQYRAPEPRAVSLAHLGVSEEWDAALAGPLGGGYVALQTLLPVDFVKGVDWQLSHARGGHPASLLGQYSTHGWWYYFPVAFALKVPLPFLLLSVVSLAWAAASYIRGRDHRLLALLAPFAFFTGLLTLNSINIGVRYYLPAYMFLFLLCGVFLDRLLVRLRHHKAAAAALVALLVGWAGLEAARAYPDHMTYFNQLASSRPHWWYLSDSNVEWGDDVRELSLYLRERNELVVGAALLGWQTLEQYGVAQASVFVPPGKTPERTRYVAVGASLLNGSTVPGGFDNGVTLSEPERVNYFDGFRRRQPEKVFGGSIYLYRVE